MAVCAHKSGSERGWDTRHRSEALEHHGGVVPSGVRLDSLIDQTSVGIIT